MRELIKKNIKDTRAEPYTRWLVKRMRGIHMPFDLVKNEIYDRQATDVIQHVLTENSNAIDIGCHEGQFLKEFIKCAPNGRHFAFEPLPQLARLLMDRFPSVTVYPYAVSDTSADTPFYVIPDSPALSGLNARGFLSPDKPRQEIKIRTERLDDIIPRETKIDLIKIDVEGAEGLVILGGRDTLTRNRPYVILEHGDASSKPFGFSSGDIYDLLVDQCGLQLSLLKNWLQHKRCLTKHQFISSRDWYFLAHPATE